MDTISTKLDLHGVAIDVSRTGTGRPIVMLHGGGGPLSGKPFVARLAARAEVIEPVHPGFAGSAIPAHFDSVEDLVYLYLDLLDELDLKDVVLMGTSLGGWVAAELAVRNSQRLSKLILVDAIGIKPGGRDTRDIPDIFALSSAEVEKLTWHDPAFAPSNAGLTDAQWQTAAANRQALGMYVWEPYMHNPKLRHRLHRIKVPTLLLWGEKDGLVTPDYGMAYRDLIPGSRLHVIERAGHAPHMEQPEAFARQVIDFAQS
jgi:pimeloyl-ACP methyl ester carboxylesterase